MGKSNRSPLTAEQRDLAGDPRHIRQAEGYAARRARQWPRRADELRSAALLGLVLAAQRYDPAAGIGFPKYLQIRLPGIVTDYLRATGEAGLRRTAGRAQQPRPEHLSISVADGDRHADRYHPAVYDSQADVDAHDAVEWLSRKLSPQVGAAVRLSYLRADAATRECAGRLLGVSQSRCSQLILDAHRLLREAAKPTAPDGEVA